MPHLVLRLEEGRAGGVMIMSHLHGQVVPPGQLEHLRRSLLQLYRPLRRVPGGGVDRTTPLRIRGGGPLGGGGGPPGVIPSPGVRLLRVGGGVLLQARDHLQGFFFLAKRTDEQLVRL
eukprot:1152769-Prorocentrum_minimum.AAC.1